MSLQILPPLSTIYGERKMIVHKKKQIKIKVQIQFFKTETMLNALKHGLTNFYVKYFL